MTAGYARYITRLVQLGKPERQLLLASQLKELNFSSVGTINDQSILLQNFGI